MTVYRVDWFVNTVPAYPGAIASLTNNVLEKHQLFKTRETAEVFMTGLKDAANLIQLGGFNVYIQEEEVT